MGGGTPGGSSFFCGFQLSGRGGRFLTPEEQVKNPVSDLEGTRKEHLLLAQKNG